jgi:cytochrome c-type biogenesis protein CcmH/NrfF
MPVTGVTDERMTMLIWAFGFGVALVMIGAWMRRYARRVRLKEPVHHDE